MPEPYYSDDWVTIYHGDARDVLRSIGKDSIDLMFTDPPYSREYEHLWSVLAEEAARLLGTGKSLLTYLGHYQLPQVIAAFEGYLRYNWLCIQRNHLAPGAMFGSRALASFKPLLWYSKGPLERGPMLIDELTHVPKGWRDRKAMHEWGQPVSLLPILRLTSPGDLVLDPFLGSGTTLVAAKDLGRRAIGIEIEERYCEIAANRCRQETLFSEPDGLQHGTQEPMFGTDEAA